MKTSRKLVVALTLAAMIATMVGTGVVSAAPTVQTAAFTDISSGPTAKYANAIDWLAGLGLVSGRGGGVFDPSAPITREEIAKIIVNFIGQGALAEQLSNSGSPFKDASDISDWAVGYVNAARALGIVNGYPDGTFRPKAKVLYQEAVTMLIRAIGDDHRAQLIGNQYPANYLAAGAVLHITAGVSGVAALPASRAEVAQLTYNAGTAPRSDPRYDPSGHLVGYQNDTVEDAPNGKPTMFDAVSTPQSSPYKVKTGLTVTAVSGSTLFAGQAWTLASAVTLHNASSLSALIGKTVDIGVNGDGQVGIVEVEQAPAQQAAQGYLNADTDAIPSYLKQVEVASATYSSWYLTDDTHYFVLFDDGSLVQLASNTTPPFTDTTGPFTKNGQSAAPVNIAGGDFASVPLNSSGFGTEVDAIHVDIPDAYIASSSDISSSWTDSGTQFTVHKNGSGTQQVSFKNTATFTTAVTWNGQEMSPKDAYAKLQSDVKAGIYPLLQIALQGSDVASVAITDQQVTGTFNGVTIAGGKTTVKVGDTSAVIADDYHHADNVGGSQNTGFPGVGSSVIAILNSSGEVVYLFGASPALQASTSYIVNITGITTDSNNNVMVTFDNEGTSYTLKYTGTFNTSVGTGYAVAVTDSSGNQITTITMMSEQNSGDTYKVIDLNISGSVVQSIGLEDISDNVPDDTTADLTISSTWEVYDSSGAYVGDGALAVGAQFTVWHNGTTEYVLVKK